MYLCDIPQELKLVGSIVHYEAANILILFRDWKDATVTVWCDNWAVVNSFTSYRICDPLLMVVV